MVPKEFAVLLVFLRYKILADRCQIDHTIWVKEESTKHIRQLNLHIIPHIKLSAATENNRRNQKGQQLSCSKFVL